MLKLLIGALGFVAGLVLSGFVFAVSMGGINVATALGEPLMVEIRLEAASKAEAGTVSARMATPDMFKVVGLDYPYGLPQLKFQIETRADNGELYLKITSTQPINEPFVTLLVELSWSSGRLLREYTFLLDPPGYAAALPQDEQAASAPKPTSATVPADEDVSVVATPATSQTFTAAAEPSNVASGTINLKVKRGDTLSKLAHQTKPDDVSLERMLVALYRANADAFNGKNMNRLKAGKILRVPDQSELDDLAQAEAVTEIRAQAADWHAYRQKLAAASVLAAEETAAREVSGKINTSVADKAPAAKESAKEVVRLSKGETPGDKTVQDKRHTLAEEAIAKKKALQESNERVALLEKNVKAMQHLMELKSQAAAKPQINTESAKLGTLPKAPVIPAISSSAVMAASAVQPAKPLQQPEAGTIEPTLLDEILDEPLYLAGLATALLALLGFGFMVTRRGKKKRGGAEDKVGSIQDSARSAILEPASSSPETGDFTGRYAAVSSGGNELANEVDPISEADLFLTFGRDEQAEEILKEALNKNPGFHQIHLKLLSIYANRKDANAFSAIARQLQDSGDAAAWEQAVVLGRKLEPNNPMYGGTGSAAPGQAAVMGAVPVATPDLGKAKEQPPALDFDLGFGAPKTPVAAVAESHDSTVMMNAPMDFDVTGSHTSLPARSGEPAEAPTMNLDDLIFDVTASHTSQPAQSGEPAKASTMNLGDLIFDVTASHAPIPAATQAKTAAAAPASADMGLAFTLDFPSADKFAVAPEKVVTKETRDIGLGEINLNLDESFAPPTPSPIPPAGDEIALYDDIATKLDLAKAYQEMGDGAGAREILEEVVRDGDDQQRAEAEALMQQLP